MLHVHTENSPTDMGDLSQYSSKGSVDVYLLPLRGVALEIETPIVLRSSITTFPAALLGGHGLLRSTRIVSTMDSLFSVCAQLLQQSN